MDQQDVVHDELLRVVVGVSTAFRITCMWLASTKNNTHTNTWSGPISVPFIDGGLWLGLPIIGKSLL